MFVNISYNKKYLGAFELKQANFIFDNTLIDNNQDIIDLICKTKFTTFLLKVN